jgi:DNA-binding transcriptional LysR family regulator
MEHNVETRQLRTFMTIVDMESFTRAGHRLGLSQSAISQQLGALERQLGVKLLVRAGAGARPTPAGEILLQYARQILHKLEEAQRVLVDYETNGAGVVRIGAGGAACHYLLPPVLKEFRDRYPRLELRVLSGHTRLTVERLLAGELDIGLITLPVSQAKLRITDVGRDELVAIAPAAHPWAGRKRIQPADVAGQPLLIYERRSQTFQLIERVLLEAGVFPHIAMEMDHLEAVTEMVRVGLGIAIVPRWAIRTEVQRGEVLALPIGKHGLARGWGLALVEANHRPHTFKAFARLCTERLPAMLGGC